MKQETKIRPCFSRSFISPALPGELRPLCWRDSHQQNLPNRRHGKVLTNLCQQVLPHSGNIRRSHLLCLPAMIEIENTEIGHVNPYFCVILCWSLTFDITRHATLNLSIIKQTVHLSVCFQN